MPTNIFEFDTEHAVFEVWAQPTTGEIGFFTARRDDCVSFFMPMDDARELYDALGEALAGQS